MKQKIRSILVILGDGFLWFVVALFMLWAFGAIYYHSLLPPVVGRLLAIAFLIGVALLVWKTTRRAHLRALLAALGVLVFVSTLLIRPSNERNWAADQAKVARVKILDGHVTIDNYRHAEYRTDLDYDAEFKTFEFELDQLASVWFIVQRFDVRDGLAHVYLSFGLERGERTEYFSLSIEVRREDGEFYNPIRGLFRAYELTHIIGDERDLIGVRTVHRPTDRVYMYRVNAKPEEVQSLFLKFAGHIEELRKRPRFYNTFLDNCANGIVRHTYELTPEPINWLDPRIVLPGYSAKFAFEKGLVGDRAGGQTFAELQEQSRIDTIAREVGITPSFSQDIRRKLDQQKVD